MVKKVSKRMAAKVKKVAKKAPARKKVHMPKEKGVKVVMGDHGRDMVEVGMRVHSSLANLLEELADKRGNVHIPHEAVMGMLGANNGAKIEMAPINLDVVSQLKSGDSLSVMDEAKNIIYGDRERTYGHPSLNLETIAQLWTVYVRRKAEVNMARFEEHFGGFEGMPPIKDIITSFTIDDVCQMMVLLKMARLLNDPKHRDGLVDQVGYIGLQDRCNG